MLRWQQPGVSVGWMLASGAVSYLAMRPACSTWPMLEFQVSCSSLPAVPGQQFPVFQQFQVSCSQSSSSSRSAVPLFQKICWPVIYPSRAHVFNRLKLESHANLPVWNPPKMSELKEFNVKELFLFFILMWLISTISTVPN